MKRTKDCHLWSDFQISSFNPPPPPLERKLEKISPTPPFHREIMVYYVLFFVKSGELNHYYANGSFMMITHSTPEKNLYMIRICKSHTVYV